MQKQVFSGNILTRENFQLKTFKANNQFPPCRIHLKETPQILQGLKV